ncbi:hypothetical protein BVJ53_13485 [Lacticaseibacillus chiayiensis]|uniref:Peptidase C39 domain-containing protein n=1 Tax=Lacticaseibacillus chiayiensis TaxID=2100821 RepID=A0A4Q1TK89_9LACO|nr:hypothetical protein BVJ53_13485 [Lacticaseibacillus chiayiensis]
MLSQFNQWYTARVEERDCGVVALNMLLKFHKSDHSLAHLRVLSKTDNTGTTALGIVKAAQGLGFETRAVRADMSLFDTADISYPFLLPMSLKMVN